MRISDWSSDVCSSDLLDTRPAARFAHHRCPDGIHEALRRLIEHRLFQLLLGAEMGEQAGFRHAQPLGQHADGNAPEALDAGGAHGFRENGRSEEHTSELQSLMRISSAVFCLKKKKNSQYLDTLQYTQQTLI